MCDFPRTLYVIMYVTVCAYGSVLGCLESFCGQYCPNVFVFLRGGGTWRCEYKLCCVEIV